MSACVSALTITEPDLDRMMWQVAEMSDTAVGVVAVRIEGRAAHLDKLFVDPQAIGLGVGGMLLRWALRRARDGGATGMLIESDPQAVRFYTRFGAVKVGEAPSEAVAGRFLPLLEIGL